jgi:type II secretion system protein H
LVTRFHKQIATCGFTLLELLVVLALAGLLMSLVPSLISAAVPGAKLRVESRDLTASLRKTRNRAIANGAQVDVMISADPPGYSTENEKPHELPSAITLEARNFMDLHAGYQPLQSGQATADDFRIRIYPDGSSSGAIITLRRKMQAYTVTVDWLLGDVSMASGLPDDEF